MTEQRYQAILAVIRWQDRHRVGLRVAGEPAGVKREGAGSSALPPLGRSERVERHSAG